MDVDSLEVGDCNAPSSYPDCPGLESLLKKGNRLHGFRSGGGLRVVYAADAGEGACSSNDKAYGEHPYVEEALRICEEDCQAGGRDYHDVYGPLYPHYLTGSSSPSGALDLWTLQGHSWDIVWENEKFIFKGSYFYMGAKVPKEISEKVISERVTLDFEADGCKWQYSPYRFPGNGEMGYSTVFLSSDDPALAPYKERSFKVEGGPTLQSLFQKLEETTFPS